VVTVGDAPTPDADTDVDTVSRRRRRLLGALAVAGTGSLAGCAAFAGEDGDTTVVTDAPTDGETTPVDGETGAADGAADLAARFAPTLYFDREEKWFPTDPRPYTSERDGETVVDGFDALDGYTERAKGGDGVPDPTVFYRVVSYVDSPLSVVQYWFYSAFDQFTTNFHWHDWEVLHVFVDTDSGDPVLHVASSHSRQVPNNEFLDPDPATTPRVLAELGSHSSALSVNDDEERFQRLPTDGSLADITNSALESLTDVIEIPVAYGLPRDEGSRLPFVVPELDGAPVYDHERLPSVTRDDLVSDRLTVRSFDDLTRPPGDLPTRETGLRFRHAERSGGRSDDVEYDLVPASEVEHVAAFTGPQLSFEFAIPQFAEDAVASHITSTSTPWSQERYDNPAADITDPVHRTRLADRYDAIGPAASLGTLVASIREAVTDPDAPTDEGLTTRALSVETVALLESEPTAIPTFGGLAVARGLPEGDHRFTVNGAGLAPHSETVTAAAGEATAAGVGGRVALVAREDALKLSVDADGTDRDLTGLAVEDDFAGRLYDAPLSGPDGVYVHRGGAYTTEVRDAVGDVGAFRVNPSGTGRVTIDRPETGVASLASFLADVAEETREDVEEVAEEDEDDDEDEGGGGGRAASVRGLAQALAAVGEAAERATAEAEAEDRERAEAALDTVASRLETVAERLAAARGGLPPGLGRAVENRLGQARRRTEQAQNARRL
jgi:hypothetical protein